MAAVTSPEPWIDEVDARYREQGLGGRLAWGSAPAVVVVDLCRGFTDPSFPAGSDLDEVVEATARLLAAARAARTPIAFTTIAFDPVREVEAEVWLNKMPALRGLLAGTRWVDVDRRLDRRPDEPLVVKRTASALAGTGLASILVGWGVDSVVLCGATTSGCIRATAVDLCQAGYPTFVPRQCVGDRAPGPHAANLLDIDAKYADVVGLEDVIDRVGPAAGSVVDAGQR